MLNERDIISRILNGDLQAFELLVKQYEQLVFYIVSKLIKQRSDAEDISQEVFIKVYNNLRTFAFKSKLSSWIASIAYRTTLNYIRDNKKERATQGAENMEEFYFTTETPEELSEKKDISTYINKLVDELPLAYKSVITLYHLNELSYQEIGEITGMPEGTVKSYLFRARKLLKDKLKLSLR